MGKYSVPEEIRKLAPKGTMVKRHDTRYYVYEYSSSKKKKFRDGEWKWTTETKMGSIIGKITLQDGFIPNSKKAEKDPILVLEYGAYAFAMSKSQETYEKLKAVFNLKEAQKMYAIALIFFVNGFTHIGDIADIYELSYLSLAFPDITLGYTSVVNLYENLGKYGEPARKFQQNLIDSSSKHIAIDRKRIASSSQDNDSPEYGSSCRNTVKRTCSGQINWMVLYDVSRKRPLVSQMMIGDRSLERYTLHMFRFFALSDVGFLADTEFTSKTCGSMMSHNGNTCIMPVDAGRKEYTYLYSHLKFDTHRYFFLENGKHRSRICFTEYTYEGKRYIAFRDVSQAKDEEKKYRDKMEAGAKGYTEEKYKACAAAFGVTILEVSSGSITAEDAFREHKSRLEIETFFDYMAHHAGCNVLYQYDDDYISGLGVIMLITGMIYADVKACTDAAGVQFQDTIQSLERLKLIGRNCIWEVGNNFEPVRELCGKLDFDLPRFISFPGL